MRSLTLLLGGLLVAATSFVTSAGPLVTGEKFVALALAAPAGTNVVERYGVPFVEQVLPLRDHGSGEIKVGSQADRIFLLGMTDALKPMAKGSLPAEASPRNLPLYGWADPTNSSVEFLIGDEVGKIRLNYTDGSMQIFPLVLGEDIWWGQAFYDYQDPFSTAAALRKAFAQALRLYPLAPVADGNYVAVIKPRPVPIASITVENSPVKRGTLVIAGMTVELGDSGGLTNATALGAGNFPPDFARFVKEKSLRAEGQNGADGRRGLEQLKRALYSSEATFKGPVAITVPPGYAGPLVTFKGDRCANVLANVFYHNVMDILAKVDEQGMYHTSTKGAISWGGYRGFGTFRTNVGAYYGVSYTRDMGRSLQEITMLGYTNVAERCAAFDFKMAHRYATDPSLKYKGVFLPPHWGDLANHPRNPSFENDGQGLTAMFIYKLWQRWPDRDAWLRANWPDVQAMGDWVLWQLAHPEISGATNGVLHTTGESANGDGYAVYPDSACMNALRALAQMADSIGKTNSAAPWRACADRMQVAIGKQYVIQDLRYGRVWTLDYANWSYNSSVLGPLIFLADYQGFAPQDEADDWRSVDEAAYHRLIDTCGPYVPFGFYGKAMGYGQGFITQSALLLDRMRDATTMLDWAAKEIYDPRVNQFDQFIVPEGVQVSADGCYWYRFGDLGNGVQEGEIIKTLRLVMGVDDTRPDRLQFYPRLPYDWDEIAVEKYPVVFEDSGKMATTFLRYDLKRTRKGMTLDISAQKALGSVAMRLGPFAKAPDIAKILVNGESPASATVEQSGDSWWVRFTAGIPAARPGRRLGNDAKP